ncbi:MAG: hypothetical protein ACJ754_00430, partial [Pyrinomonadaceae bacterium]
PRRRPRPLESHAGLLMLMWYELADTLIAVVESVQAPPGSGLLVTEADVEMPLEVMGAVQNGRLIFYGSPPHTRWKSGVLPPVSIGRIHVGLLEEPEEERSEPEAHREQ